MKIKIRDNAAQLYIRRCYKYHPASCGMLHSPDFMKQLELVQGKWLDVETKYLFEDQFNTAPIEGVSALGLRIMRAWVEEIEDDFRIGRVKCGYCGNHFEDDGVSEKCPHCGQTEYIMGLLPKNKTNNKKDNDNAEV